MVYYASDNTDFTQWVNLALFLLCLYGNVEQDYIWQKLTPGYKTKILDNITFIMLYKFLGLLDLRLLENKNTFQMSDQS